MDFTPDPGNSVFEDTSLNIEVISLMLRDGRPWKLDIGDVDLAKADGALGAAKRLTGDALMDFIECDQISFDDDEDDD